MAQTPITDNSLAILGTVQLGEEKMWRPTTTLNLNLQANTSANQLQQVKAAPLNGATGVQLPQPVSGVRVTKTPAGSSQYKISISFLANPSDQYFQGVQVLLRQGSGQPAVVSASPGSSSPVSFLVSRSGVASTFIVQSVGQWGNSPLASSPAVSISLS